MTKTLTLRAMLVLASVVACSVAALGQGTHPVVDLSENCVVGGVAAGKWLEADKLSPMLKGGERYKLYTLSGPAGEAVGGKPESIGEPCEDVTTVKFGEDRAEKIAVAGDWDAMPRVPRVMSNTDPVYRQVVAGILRRHGFVRPKINVLQVLRVDLDGDGKEEVIVGATYLAGGLGDAERGMAFRAQPGDYSLVFVRKIVGNGVRDIMLAEEYYPRNKPGSWTPTQHKVAGVLDLNGDGKLEIILHGAYYEGSWSTAFRMDGNKPTNVFGCGCGV